MKIPTWQERYNEACMDPKVSFRSSMEMAGSAKQAEIYELRDELDRLIEQGRYRRDVY